MGIDPGRSAAMRAVKSKDTTPELLVRTLIHGLGYRYRLHRRDLPGTPDLAFPSRKLALFVHGCFWHGHDCKRGARMPKANNAYWVAKIDRNRQRDRETQRALGEMGWTSFVIWECELRDREELRAKIISLMSTRQSKMVGSGRVGPPIGFR